MSRRTIVERELLDLFLAEGFVALTVDDIARRLSCSKATLYSIAPNRGDLVRHTVGIYFRDSARRAEIAIERAPSSYDAIRAYLAQIASDLRPASPQFLADLSSYPPAREIYRLNTRAAARRVGGLLEAGSERGELDSASVGFIGEVVALTIELIYRGDLRERYSLSDADAFQQLANLVIGTRDVDEVTDSGT